MPSVIVTAHTTTFSKLTVFLRISHTGAADG